jgi:hypothetical protein
MAVWRMIRMVDLPWQSTNKRSLETVMFSNFIWPACEMAVCCAKPPYQVTALKTLEYVQQRSKKSGMAVSGFGRR